jgi:hypothetical protein
LQAGEAGLAVWIMTDKLRCIAILAATSAGATPVAGQGLDDRYWIEAGGYLPKVDSTVRVAATAGPNLASTIDLESDLDLDDRKALPQVSAGVRLGDGGWSLEAEYYALRRTSSVSMRREIVFDDAVYPVGVRVDSSFDSSIYRATIGYAFLRKRDTRIGAAVGLHATDFEVALSGEARLGGVTTQGVARRRTFLAPLPTVGLFASQRLLPDLVVSGRADYLSLKIDEYSGRLLNAQASIVWRFARNVGVGAMYRHVDYRVNVDKERWNGRLQYSFSGPALFLQVGLD